MSEWVVEEHYGEEKLQAVAAEEANVTEKILLVLLDLFFLPPPPPVAFQIMQDPKDKRR